MAEDNKLGKRKISEFIFSPTAFNIEELSTGIWISREELFIFYQEYKAILPDSIMKWESLFE